MENIEKAAREMFFDPSVTRHLRRIAHLKPSTTKVAKVVAIAQCLLAERSALKKANIR